MINSKLVNPGHVKGIKIFSNEKDKKTPEWNKKLQRFMSRINKVISKIPFLWRIHLFSDIEWYPLQTALSLVWNRFVKKITLKHFRQQLKSGWAYFKQGYKAYDFDSAFAMYVFIWKLERLAKVLTDDNIHYGDNENAKQIEKAVHLINRVMKDNYEEEYEKEVVEKYGDNIRYVANLKGINKYWNKNKGPFKNKHIASCSIHRREKWTPELDKEIDKAERAKYKKAYNKRMKEWKKALGIIEKHFFEWWN